MSGPHKIIDARRIFWLVRQVRVAVQARDSVERPGALLREMIVAGADDFESALHALSLGQAAIIERTQFDNWDAFQERATRSDVMIVLEHMEETAESMLGE